MPEFAQLVEGYRRFRAQDYLKQKTRYDTLASEGQAPPIMTIGCCDSRVDPATIFDTVPGQVFALRNVANLVPPYGPGGGLHGASAAIEFGVCGLGVRHIVVLGHGLCGGIRAALHGGDLGEPGPSFVDDWMGIIAEARDAVIADPGDNPQLKLEHEAIKVSLANLLTFPFIKRRVDAGELKLHGAWFAIGEGRLYILNDATGAFESIE